MNKYRCYGCQKIIHLTGSKLLHLKGRRRRVCGECHAKAKQ
jgi:hypothetical protein